MATTEEILTAATKLGKLIASHEASKKFQSSISALEKDPDAQRVLNDLNRHAATVQEKAAGGQPIEVGDKHKLEELRSKVVMNSVLGQFQMAQMDFIDLMRKVDEAMTGEVGGFTDAPVPGAAGGAGPIVTG